MDAVGPHEETIIDYSVFDAIRAGFTKVVFVIRESFSEDFKKIVSQKFEDRIEIHHVYQSLETGIPELPCPPGREKPWGTGHAILSAKGVVTEPFAVINADDFYGAGAFDQAYNFLTGLTDPKLGGMIGYKLENTLSKNGHVNRGICELDDEHFLVGVTEREQIRKTNDRIIYGNTPDLSNELSSDEVASMNFWLLHHDVYDEIEYRFREFLEKRRTEEKSEFYIPAVIDELISEELLQVLVMKSEDNWYGVTYREDKQSVQEAIAELHQNGRYPESLA